MYATYSLMVYKKYIYVYVYVCIFREIKGK